MPERRQGLNPLRAAELEFCLERQFIIAGLGKPEAEQGLTANAIIEKKMRERNCTLDQALDSYLQARVVDSQLQVQIALICGELFGADDLSQMEARLKRSEDLGLEEAAAKG